MWMEDEKGRKYLSKSFERKELLMISVELVCRFFLFVERNQFSKLNFPRKWKVEKMKMLTSYIEHKSERKISKEIKKVFLPPTIILLTFLMITFAVTLSERRKEIFKTELVLCLSPSHLWCYVCIAVNFLHSSWQHTNGTPDEMTNFVKEHEQ